MFKSNYCRKIKHTTTKIVPTKWLPPSKSKSHKREDWRKKAFSAYNYIQNTLHLHVRAWCLGWRCPAKLNIVYEGQVFRWYKAVNLKSISGYTVLTPYVCSDAWILQMLTYSIKIFPSYDAFQTYTDIHQIMSISSVWLKQLLLNPMRWHESTETNYKKCGFRKGNRHSTHCQTKHKPPSYISKRFL